MRARPEDEAVQEPVHRRQGVVPGDPLLVDDPLEATIERPPSERRGDGALEDAQRAPRGAQRRRRVDVEIRGRDVVAMGGEVQRRPRRRVELVAQLVGERPERRAHARAVEAGHRQIDVARVAVVAPGMKGQRARQQNELGRTRIDAAPVVEIQQREPELAPRRDREHAGRSPEPAPCLLRDRLVAPHAQQAQGDVHQRRHEHVAAGFRVQPPGAVRRPRGVEVAHEAGARRRVHRPADGVAHDRVLGGDHGTPDHLAFPAAAPRLQAQQMLEGALTRRRRARDAPPTCGR